VFKLPVADMKTLQVAVLCATSLFLSACPKPPAPVEPKVVRLPLLAKTECELVYRSSSAQVVENFCDTQWKPVKVQIQDQKYAVNWLDERTSRRVFDKGCGLTDGCYYELVLDGVTVNGRYAYTTHIVQGEYTFQIDANENSRVLKEDFYPVPAEKRIPVASLQTKTPAGLPAL
jgi:hypothetical protein